MCGICAAVGQKNQIKNVLLGLEQLDYRGYDSAGVAFWQNDGLQVCKCVGSVKNLEEKLQLLHPDFQKKENVGKKQGPHAENDRKNINNFCAENFQTKKQDFRVENLQKNKQDFRVENLQKNKQDFREEIFQKKKKDFHAERYQKKQNDFHAERQNLKENAQSVHAVIGHTRWATHGQVSEQNAHPHLSQNGLFAMVHNGIVENFADLQKQFCINNLKSETDTEIFVNLVEKMALQNQFQKQKTSVQLGEKLSFARLQKKQKQNENLQFFQKEREEEAPLPLQHLMQAANHVRGSYAVALLCAQPQFCDQIFVAKNGSPLMIAAENGVGMVASDLSVFVGKFSSCYVLDDGEFAVVSAKNIKIFDKNGKKMQKNAVFLENFEDFDFLTQKSNFQFFMQKEIAEQPAVLRKTYFKYFLEGVLSQQNLQQLKKFRSFCFVACGTAYHACLMGAHFVQQLCQKPSQVHLASEFRYSNPILRKSCLYIFVSQSGETADTIACAKMVKDAGFCTLCVTNVPYCSLNSLADFVLPTFAGREVAVASTKAYTAQIFTLLIFALLLFSNKTSVKKIFEQKKECVQKIPEKEFIQTENTQKENTHTESIQNENTQKENIQQKDMQKENKKDDMKTENIQQKNMQKENIQQEKSYQKVQTKEKLQSKIDFVKNFALSFQNPVLPKNLLEKIVRFKKIFFIGRGADYVTALEGALKLKEIAYIGCIGIAAGELKHGTLALVDENTLVVAICTQNALKEKMESNIREVQSRGGKVLVESQLPLSVDADFWIQLPVREELFMPIESIVPLQQLAFEFSVALGNNPDKPRNLAKSVTVE